MRIYQNIGTIDARFADEQTLKQIKKLSNIAALVVSKEQQEMFSNMTMTNVGAINILSKDVNLLQLNGNLTIDDKYLSQLSKNTALMMNGDLIVKPLHNHYELDKLVAGFINGNIYATSNDLAKLSERCQVNGNMITYNDGDLIIPNRFVLNDIELLGMPNNSDLVLDVLEALEDLDDQDISTAINSIKVNSLIIATKANIRKLVSKISNYNQVEKIIAPDGYAFYERLTLDDSTLEFLASRKLFISGSLNIVASPENILEHVDSIIASKISVAKNDADLIRHLFKDVKQIKVRDPKSIHNMSKLVITKGLLEENEHINIENMGKLVFDKDISASLIASSVSSIVNMGKISCTKSQYTSVLKACSQNMGAIKDDLEMEDSWEEDNDVVISNMAYLKL